MALSNSEYAKAITFGSVTDADATDGLESEFELIEAGFDLVQARLDRGIAFSGAIPAVPNDPPGVVGFSPSDGDDMDGPFFPVSGFQLPKMDQWNGLVGMGVGAFISRIASFTEASGEYPFLPLINGTVNEDYYLGGGYWESSSIAGVFGATGIKPVSAPASFPLPVLVVVNFNIILETGVDLAGQPDIAIAQYQPSSDAVFGRYAYRYGGSSSFSNGILATTALRYNHMIHGVVMMEQESDGTIPPIGVRMEIGDGGGTANFTASDIMVFVMPLGTSGGDLVDQ